MTFQGMFLKRQSEVSRVYSDIIEKKLFNSKNVVEIVLNGSGSKSVI